MLNLSGLLPLLNDIPSYRQLVKDLRSLSPIPYPLSLKIPVAARPYLVAALQRDLRQPVLWVVARTERAKAVYEQLRSWAARPETILRLPEPDALPYERIPWTVETIRERLSVLTALSTDGGGPSVERQDTNQDDMHPVIVASARALMQKTIPLSDFAGAVHTLRVGQRASLQSLLSTWYSLGYEPTAVVEEPGNFSRRGGIVDIFPPNCRWPVRVEFFGDEIESLRLFDPTTQRSREKVSAVTLTPASEALPRYGKRAARLMAQLDLSACHPAAQTEFKRDREALEEDQWFRGIEFYLPCLYDRPGMLPAYLPPGGLTLIDDWSEFEATMADLEAQALSLHDELIEAGELPAGLPLPYFTWDELWAALTRGSHCALGYDGAMSERMGLDVRSYPSLGRIFAAAPRYGGQLKRLLEDCQAFRKSGGRTVIISRQARRLAELLAERGVGASLVEAVSEPPPPRSVTLVGGVLAEGWTLGVGSDQWPEEKPLTTLPSPLSLLTDADIFGWIQPRPRRAIRPRGVAPESFFTDVRPGDYVVHIEHGIGLFQGLVKLVVDGMEREYLQVDYAAGDRLYVPIHQVDRLSRYIGASDRPPTIHRLGTTDWARVKARAQRAVEDIAQDLLELYSAREVVPGHAFSPDTLWQAELEASFPYVETEDQLKAIETVKADMEEPRPMDRLICGDVGYGKTEVALRAAFKAVMDGKQVALLVPTTVLAQQHFRTFQERLAPFPVVAEMLSRFRSRKGQQEILEGLRAGTVDIVIGTHRLIQKDVAFKDLGLLIIDEEQRFGVTHKERLKQMRTEVDVLTLTATPIPRTLHMSLTGVRDMSTIETPPEERLPIKTHVAEYDETLIRKAILRELDRGGQVYFVHNRVQGIRQMAQRLARIVPEATLAIAHGQMKERELEQVMLDFVDGKVDILVCTSIIESGLDIPNVNTLVVNRADRFGLAQLYQLRGRVGRSAVRAYAYFLYSKHQRLSETARKRLETILEASELGAGFHVAMRDLEIRGAGELLGARQHGHIAAVGFDLYCRLLARAVQELRGKEPTRLLDEETAYLQPLAESVQINLPLAVYLPEDYVLESGLRLQLYRRLAGLTTVAQIDEMARELRDRFGKLPQPAENLLYQLHLKVLALQVGVKAITTEEGQVIIRADGLEGMDRGRLQGLMDARLGGRARVGRRQVWLPLDGRGEVWQEELLTALEVMAHFGCG